MFNFAHLIGGNAKKATEDEDKNKNVNNPDDQDDKEKGKKADNDNPDDDKEKKDNPDGKSSKKAEDEDEDDDDDEKNGKKAERQRCALIFSSPHAAGKADMAANLAFNTNLSADEAITILAAMHSNQKSSNKTLDDRMAKVEQFNIGADAQGQHNPNDKIAAATNLYLQAVGKK